MEKIFNKIVLDYFFVNEFHLRTMLYKYAKRVVKVLKNEFMNKEWSYYER